MKIIQLNELLIGNTLPFILIAGPCQIESKNHAIYMADSIYKICEELQIQFIYKSSFDKANRTSINGKRGIGLKKSLPIFAEIKKQIGCQILTDIHEASQADILAEYVNILQIPAMLCRQTDLIIAAAKTKKCVNIKKGQFLSPYDMQNVIDKCLSVNNDRILITERGNSFGYNTLVNDMKGLQVMKNTNYPVIFDATHSVQQPGVLNNSTGGQREFIEILARCAIAASIAGIFIETHDNPNNAPSDSQCMLPLNCLKDLLIRIKDIDFTTKKHQYLNISS